MDERKITREDTTTIRTLITINNIMNMTMNMTKKKFDVGRLGLGTITILVIWLVFHDVACASIYEDERNASSLTSLFPEESSIGYFDYSTGSVNDNEIDYEQRKQYETTFFGNPHPVAESGEDARYLINNGSSQTSLSDFKELCVLYFASSDVRRDNRITSDETATFFEYLCDTISNPSCRNTDIPFWSLDIDIQRKFIKIICPRDAGGNVDVECLDGLNQDVNQLAIEITTENVNEVDENIEIFCEEIYPLSTDYHFGTLAPTPHEPSSNPSGYLSSRPSTKPSLRPSLKPTIPRPTEPTMSPKPTHTESTSPSLKPSKSNRPSFRPSLTFESTTRKRYLRSFTYMMGVNSIKTLRDIIGNEQNDILNLTCDAIRSELIALSPSIANNMIVTKVRHTYRTEVACTDKTPRSNYCIMLVGEVTLEATVIFTDEEIDNSVYPIIKESMRNGRFRNELNRNEVLEIVYMKNGDFIVSNDLPPSKSGLSRTEVAVIILSVFVFVTCVACVVARSKEISIDERVVEQGFTDERVDRGLHLHEEHFEDDDDMRFISTHQKKIRRVMAKNGKKSIGDIDQKDTFNDSEQLPEVKTTAESNENEGTGVYA